MPELPDVEVFRRYVDATSLHKRIDGVHLSGSDILEKTTESELAQGLRDREIKSTDRHGKYLFAHTDSDPILMLHFGMTGDLKYFKALEKEPEYSYLRLDFAHGYHLAYVMVRKLGLIGLIDDQEDFITRKELGPDVGKPGFDFERFAKCLEGRRGMIKPALMHQKIMAGLGNVYVDEILYQAEIHPEVSVAELRQDQLKRIHRVMRRVLRIAVKRKAEPNSVPDTWIIPKRGAEGAGCPNCGGSIEKIKVSGRSTYFCPRCQST